MNFTSSRSANKIQRTKQNDQSEFLSKASKKVLKPDGIVNLKTDSEFMHGYTLGLCGVEGHEVPYANHKCIKK
jgi:tRNA (guanine-N7-)-methyltransferase